jgi:hypothetical protein
MHHEKIRFGILLFASVALIAVLALAASATTAPRPTNTPVAQMHTTYTSSAWSSPWVYINRGQTITFTHNLGGDPDDYAVELWFNDLDQGAGINHIGYGAMEVGANWFGAHWQHLTSNTIQVRRLPDDNIADMIRIRVWVVPEPPDYDSGWMDINPGETITISHNLGITATDLNVGLWFSGTTRGIHHFGFGGLAVDSLQEMLGGHWQNLTTSTVEVARHPDDSDIEEVRLIVVHAATPDYDSLEVIGDWQPITGGTTFTFTHSLNWDPDMLLVRAECYDATGQRGINVLFAGGNHDWFDAGHFQGSTLSNLTHNTVAMSRLPDDEFCSHARVRIWRRAIMTYLPLIAKGVQ